MNRDLTYYRLSDGSPVTIPAGSAVDVSMGRMEAFWGAYAHAVLFF